MGILHASDEKIREEVGRLSAARDLRGLAHELRRADPRWHQAAAAALAPYGAAAAEEVIDETLPLDDERGARLATALWTTFEAIGIAAAPVVIGRAVSIETLLAPKVRARLRYYERAMVAIGPAAQSQLAPLVRRDGPWKAMAEACLRARGSRLGRLNTDAAATGAITVPIDLGEQRITADEAEEAIRATTRQWAVTCLLGLVGRGAILGERSTAALEEAVVDALGPRPPLRDELPVLEPVGLMHRFEAGERGLLTELENRCLEARTSPASHPPEERRAREDLLIGTLALGVLRRYSHHGAGPAVDPAGVAERFAGLARPERDHVGPDAGVAMSRLAGFELCCAMHLKIAAAGLVERPPLAGLVAPMAALAGPGTLQRHVTLETVRLLRGASAGTGS